MGMRKGILLLLPFLAGAVWHWLWEFIRSLLYERGSRMMTPIIDTITPDQIIHWGPTIVLPSLGIWLIWKTRPAIHERTQATASGVSDPGLFLECTLAIPPIKVPADGRLFFLGLFPTPIENGGGGLGEVTMPPGTDYKGGAVDLPLNVHRCQITNYSTVTAVNIDIALSLIFSEVVEPKTGGYTSGSKKLARSWPIRIGKIDPGVETPFVFYIFNQVPFFVQVSFPEEAVIRRLGDPTPQTIQLTTSNHYPISFGPVFEKKAGAGVEAKP